MKIAKKDKSIQIELTHKKVMTFLYVLLGLVIISIFALMNIHKVGNKYLYDNIEDLDYKIITPSEIRDVEVEDWYLARYKERGIYDISAKDNKYILLSAGEREDGYLYEFNYVDVVGFRDKINVHAFLDKTDVKHSKEEYYPNLLIMLKGNDSRQVIAPQVNLFTGLEDNPKKTVADLPKEEVTFEGIFEGIRLEKAELIVNDSYTTLNEKMLLSSNVKDLENLRKIQDDFIRNDIVKGKFLYDGGEKTLLELEKIEETIIQAKFSKITNEGVELLIQDYPRTFGYADNVLEELKNMKEGDYLEITVKNKDKIEPIDKENEIVITKVLKL